MVAPTARDAASVAAMGAGGVNGGGGSGVPGGGGRGGGGGDSYRESAKYELPDRSVVECSLDQSAWQQHQRSYSTRRWVSRAHLALRLRNSSLSLSPALCTDVFVLAAHPFLRRRLLPTRPAVTMSLPCPCGWAFVNLPFPGGLECLSVSDLVISGIGGSRPRRVAHAVRADPAVWAPP